MTSFPCIRRFAITIPAELHQVSAARRLMETHLSRWVCPLLDDASLVAQELIANAVRHGCSGPDETVVLSVEQTNSRLLIAVDDPSPKLPHVRRAADDDSSGRGLLMVRALASCWGYRAAEDGRGKRVWCILAPPGSPSSLTSSQRGTFLCATSGRPGADFPIQPPDTVPVQGDSATSPATATTSWPRLSPPRLVHGTTRPKLPRVSAIPLPAGPWASEESLRPTNERRRANPDIITVPRSAPHITRSTSP
ncbi:hypothetical protein GCM10009716_13600 [Streptomyces sodiiphilus]|uniref:Histidine kinase/HSP90-like ATPase domain-containing protein n=1 Tax=Streptomyces sodiiphilus TaxID=226217 RepID=A0ABN2P0B6_9ACTN